MLGTFAWALKDLEPFELNDSNYGYTRAAIVRDLERQGGKHIIFVRYFDAHDKSEEWIYNDADIAESPIIWAHDEGDSSNRELTKFYSGRRLWLLEADTHPAELIPIQ